MKCDMGTSNNYDVEDRGEPADNTAPVYSSAFLFKGTGEIRIEHAGFSYRLKITRQGKLILNK
jgi:hemin uptake protein HemP